MKLIPGQLTGFSNYDSFDDIQAVDQKKQLPMQIYKRLNDFAMIESIFDSVFLFLHL